MILLARRPILCQCKLSANPFSYTPLCLLCIDIFSNQFILYIPFHHMSIVNTTAKLYVNPFIMPLSLNRSFNGQFRKNNLTKAMRCEAQVSARLFFHCDAIYAATTMRCRAHRLLRRNRDADKAPVPRRNTGRMRRRSSRFRSH